MRAAGAATVPLTVNEFGAALPLIPWLLPGRKTTVAVRCMRSLPTPLHQPRRTCIPYTRSHSEGSSRSPQRSLPPPHGIVGKGHLTLPCHGRGRRCPGSLGMCWRPQGCWEDLLGPASGRLASLNAFQGCGEQADELFCPEEVFEVLHFLNVSHRTAP